MYARLYDMVDRSFLSQSRCLSRGRQIFVGERAILPLTKITALLNLLYRFCNEMFSAPERNCWFLERLLTIANLFSSNEDHHKPVLS